MARMGVMIVSVSVRHEDIVFSEFSDGCISIDVFLWLLLCKILRTTLGTFVTIACFL